MLNYLIGLAIWCGKRTIYECGDIVSFSKLCAERDVTASGRPLVNEGKGKRSERREGKEYSINGRIANASRGAAPVQLQQSTHHRCSGVDVTHADAARRKQTRVT